MVNAADAQRVFCFIFGTIRDFIVEPAEAMITVSVSFFGLVGCQVAKDFCKRLSYICHESHPS